LQLKLNQNNVPYQQLWLHHFHSAQVVPAELSQITRDQPQTLFMDQQSKHHQVKLLVRPLILLHSHLALEIVKHVKPKMSNQFILEPKKDISALQVISVSLNQSARLLLEADKKSQLE